MLQSQSTTRSLSVYGQTFIWCRWVCANVRACERANDDEFRHRQPEFMHTSERRTSDTWGGRVTLLRSPVTG